MIKRFELDFQEALTLECVVYREIEKLESDIRRYKKEIKNNSKSEFIQNSYKEFIVSSEKQKKELQRILKKIRDTAIIS